MWSVRVHALDDPSEAHAGLMVVEQAVLAQHILHQLQPQHRIFL
jgi:hypothetical protein